MYKVEFKSRRAKGLLTGQELDLFKQSTFLDVMFSVCYVSLIYYHSSANRNVSVWIPNISDVFFKVLGFLLNEVLFFPIM